MVVPGDNIIPYKGTQKYIAVTESIQCHIRTECSDGTNGFNKGSQGEMSGGFKLLRVPPGGDKYEIEPNTGIVLKH